MNQAINGELLSLCNGKSPEDVLTKEAVLEWAKNNTDSATYDYLKRNGAFNGREAMRRLGLLLCGRLIRHVYVRVEYAERKSSGEVLVKTVNMRAMQSLGTDRKGDGGYRQSVTILGDPEMRAELLKTARAELEALRRRYKHLVELADVWDTIVRAGGVVVET